MNFDEGGDFFPQGDLPFSEDMDFGPNDGFNGNKFMGRGGWRGGPPRGGRGGPPRGGRGGPPGVGWGGYNNMQGPPQNYGNWNDDQPYGWGRGFGPNGPPMQSKDIPPIRFLLRCGVARENLKNLPINLLKLIEPGYCGVCDMVLDSFGMARLHYMSRNHSKKQQKWLSQAPGDMGYHSTKEAPMKSRDLYCELCDVQITSKAHAESHYEGKAHRAIVEGRKVPRNPALQKKNMSARLDQLIRREKRCLKPVEKVAKLEKEDPKPFQQELFCAICKTSVTCTEQMTMHLNGKRHLSKEKQHILKMMKAGADGKQAENTEEGPADENDEGNPESQTGEGEDKYDWGNGSGAWDENEVQPAAE